MLYYLPTRSVFLAKINKIWLSPGLLDPCFSLNNWPIDNDATPVGALPNCSNLPKWEHDYGPFCCVVQCTPYNMYIHVGVIHILVMYTHILILWLSRLTRTTRPIAFNVRRVTIHMLIVQLHINSNSKDSLVRPNSIGSCAFLNTRARRSSTRVC